MTGICLGQVWRTFLCSVVLQVLHYLSLGSCRPLPDGEAIHLSVMLPSYPLSSTMSQGPWLPEGRLYPYHLQMVMPAMNIAVKKAQNDTLQNHEVELHVEDTRCFIDKAQLASADLYMNYRVLAFFGPACEYPNGPVGRFANHWNLPLITAGGQSSSFTAAEYARVMTNVMPPHEKLGDFVGKIFLRYGWTRAVLLYHDGNDHIRDTMFMAGSTFKVLSQVYHLNLTEQKFSEYQHPNYKDLLEKTVRPSARGG